MTAPDGEEFKDAIRQLHRTKDAAYRDAWKKRGEVMSIMANIARKVDRLEYVTNGAPATPGELLLDTAIDLLLVYCIKYQTYIGDQDSAVAATIFQGHSAAQLYSDGPDGFEALLNRLDLTPIDHDIGYGRALATQGTLLAFATLEACFRNLPAHVGERSANALALTRASVILIGSLTREAPERYRDFLMTYRRGAG